VSQYIPTIGIECHVQLKTKTKLFAAVGNDAREAPPNTLISHICLGMPGALPVLNQAAVELAMKAAFALGTKPQEFSAFDRKHYFYPDLPKGYQISQLYHPIILGGYVDIAVDGEQKRIGITRAHLEEDAGKNTHPAGKDYSLVDLNRAGTPLLEIVSEPDIHSAVEAKAYARELYLLMKYADVSDANLYYGNMRFDVNVSVSKDPGKLGKRTETKNLNSFRAVEKAVEYEIKRQTEELESGREIIQETRGWDDAKQKTFSQRSKEESHDYRYMPDPDIPPTVLSDKDIQSVNAAMPRLPNDYRKQLGTIGIDMNTVEDIVSVPETAQTLSRILQASSDIDARRVAFWLLQEQPEVEALEAQWVSRVEDSQLIKLSQMVGEGKLSSSAAKRILGVLQTDGGDAMQIAEEHNLIQESDEGAIAAIVDKILLDNPKAANDVRSGEMKAIGFLVGQVMKESKGKANPPMVQELIKKKLLQ
jgi:aspartyl-tRNA(Asn)/glutamyl-tRNA(Gln) amidotransferase subunit B